MVLTAMARIGNAGRRFEQEHSRGLTPAADPVLNTHDV